MKIYQKMPCNLNCLRWRKSNLVVLTLVFFLSCSSESNEGEGSQESNEDVYQVNFLEFIKNHSQYYDKYVVLDYGRCHYCDTKVKQALLNMDCLTAREGVAFILYSQKRLPDDLASLVNGKNLFHYQDIKKPILMDYPRIYSVAKTKNDQMSIDFNWYNAQSFADEIESLCARRVSGVYISTFRIKNKGIPVAGSTDFMILSKEKGYSYEEIEGVSFANLRKGDQLDAR